MNEYYQCNLADLLSICDALTRHCQYDNNNFGGELYCPRCAATRRAWVTPIHLTRRVAANASGPRTGPQYEQFNPSNTAPCLLVYACAQCDTSFTAVVYEDSPGVQRLAIFPNVPGGLSTPRTPRSVSYYLDQAQRCRSVNANSAAISMYRAGLEQLLYERGFTNGMLDAKIRELKAQIDGGSSPTWARDLDTEYLAVMKELGNAAIHPNGGDITKQSSFDSALMIRVERTLQGLLHLAYEEPVLRSANLAALRTASATVRKA